MMTYLDNTNSILEWNSEEVVIPYLSPLDRKAHRYFTDFYAKIRDSSGGVTRYILEVKPRRQRKPPRKVKNTCSPNKQARYIKEVQTYMINQAKWEAAERWCKKHGYVFKVLDEIDLGI